MTNKLKVLFLAGGFVALLATSLFVWLQATETKVAQTRVHFHLDGDFGSSLIRIAKAEGIFTKYGIDAQLDDYADGPSAIRAMNSSPNTEISLATSAGYSFVAEAQSNKEIKIISQLANDEDNYYWVVREGKGNGSLAGLRGLKLAYPPISGYRTFVQLSLRDQGLTDSDVELVPVFADDFAAAMLSGKIDAHPSRILVTEETFNALNGAAYEIHDIGAYNWHNVLSTKNHTIRNHPEVLRAILEALLETQSASYLEPKKARSAIAESLGIEISQVPEGIIAKSNVRLSNGLLLQMLSNRFLLASDQGRPESDYFEDPRDLIDPTALNATNPVVVHLD